MSRHACTQALPYFYVPYDDDLPDDPQGGEDQPLIFTSTRSRQPYHTFADPSST